MIGKLKGLIKRFMYISILVLILGSIMLYFRLFNIKLINKNSNKENDTLIYFEKFSNKSDLCDNTEDREKLCGEFNGSEGSKHSCNNLKCCIWMGDKCMEGSKDGPLYFDESLKGKEYYHLNNKYLL